jgi:hypothetical protein
VPGLADLHASLPAKTPALAFSLALIERLGDTACDCGLRIGVTAERHGKSDRVLDIGGIQESDNRFGDGPLA